MSNFNFLHTTFPDLARLGELAERNLYDDPQTTMSKLRLMCERIANNLCQIESIDSNSQRQVDRLTELRKEDIIPQRVLDHFHSIRISGNKAIHANEGTEGEALLRLKQARNICIWFFQTYSDNTEFESIGFIKPIRQVSIQETNKVLEEEIEKLRDENNKLLLDKQKKILEESQSDKDQRRKRSIKSSEQLDISEAEARLIVDEALINLGWEIIPYSDDLVTSDLNNHAVEELPTGSGPVDYALFVEGKLLGLLEAKRPSVNPRNVLDQQTKRYSKSVYHGMGNWNGYKVPFLYASNSEQIFHLDVRKKSNTDRELFGYHSPQALKEKFERDNEFSDSWLSNTKLQHPWIRSYQDEAVKGIENNIIGGKHKMMLAMATGTGKTFTASNLIYRLLKSGKSKRILFLVDRKSLASQTVRSFSSFETPDGNKLHQEYEIYSQKFQRKEFEDEDFDNKVLPNEYLTNPDASKTFVYVSTIQRMSINLFGKGGMFGVSKQGDDEDNEEPENALDIPIHAFDVIIADECHRGYTSKETNLWRSTLNHFDAIKIGLTATPAAHTIAFFGSPIYEYPFDKAVAEGYLVDYDPIPVYSNVKINGAFLKDGEMVGDIDSKSGKEKIHYLEAEREYNSSDIELKITVPDTNRKIIEELKKHSIEFEEKYGRFPKTLIFAVNDINHISHADEIVNMATKIFDRGNDFVKKITGNKNVDRPLQRIKEFRNRPEPKIVVTVDMLSTGVDIPSLEFIVFLRPVKSRILWEQMLGRGTRLSPEIHKDRFYVFDCFGGGLFKYFKNASKMSEKIKPDKVSLREVIERIYRNEDRDYNVKRLVTRLRRIEKSMSGEAIEQFEAYIPNGDVGKFAENLPKLLIEDFIKTIKLLRDEGFQDLLKNYKRPKRTFVKAYEVEDEVHSERLFKDSDSNYLKPEDYLSQFSTYVKENQKEIEAFKIILETPSSWNTNALNDLRNQLIKNGYPEYELRDAHKIIYDKEMIDIISMIKHAVKEEEQLLSVSERVDQGITSVFKDMRLTNDQEKWVEYIREHLKENLTIDQEDFNYMPIFEAQGGWGKFKKIFGDKSKEIITELNKAIAA